MKPSRSDELLSDENAARAVKLVQKHFDALAPKRPQKPARSEPVSKPSGSDLSDFSPATSIPEHRKFQDLESRSERRLVTEASSAPEAELYVENSYYKDLLAAENGEHHTTGTGFIKIEAGSATGFHIVDDFSAAAPGSHTRCNPATNDWVPATIGAFSASYKPRRSDP